jgi:uncharacterized tellurite resistance protein B-like protein
MKTELYLKTLFCCSACDGSIAPEEIALIRQVTDENELFAEMDIEGVLNGYVDTINKQGKIFLKDYLYELATEELSTEEQLKIIELSIRMIEADNQILYSEVKFFKKLRACLSVTDDEILAILPDKEDYLLPDISAEDKDFDLIGGFDKISFDSVVDNAATAQK